MTRYKGVRLTGVDHDGLPASDERRSWREVAKVRTGLTTTVVALDARRVSAAGDLFEASSGRDGGASAARAIDGVTAVSYSVYMSEMTATDARERFSEALAASSREPVFITRHGKRVAALVTAEFYDRAIEALEDAEDIASARAALDEDGPSIPWEVVKADLGLA
jgi:antitoxin Phd